MAKYRTTDAAAGQGLFMSINLKEQLLPGTFEHMLDEIIGTKINLSIFDKNYNNDITGAPAVPPAALLKLIIYGYSKGSISSRKLDELNRNNIIAKALTGDISIHWTTIADFISGNSQTFNDTFVKVLMYCSEVGLIGGRTFAIDGLRLPSNASIELSGTKQQLEKRLLVYEKMAAKHLSRHQRADAQGAVDNQKEINAEKRQAKLSGQIDKISTFLATMKEQAGKKGRELKSNVTDNESAMIRSSKGFIQGYTGLGLADQKAQVVLSATAVGSSDEHEYLPEMLDKMAENLEGAGFKTDEREQKPLLLGDSNNFSEDNLRACQERGIEVILADGRGKEKPEGQKQYEISDFVYHDADNEYECPQGNRLVYKQTYNLNGVPNKMYQADIEACRQCSVFTNCFKKCTEPSQIKKGKRIGINKSNEPGNLSQPMREYFKTEECQEKYAARIQIIEPVFANIRHCKGLNRFTLRGKAKVQGQWLLYCIVHNLGKCLKGYNTGLNSA